jgi:hypothetical protein
MKSCFVEEVTRRVIAIYFFCDFIQKACLNLVCHIPAAVCPGQDKLLVI